MSMWIGADDNDLRFGGRCVFGPDPPPRPAWKPPPLRCASPKSPLLVGGDTFGSDKRTTVRQLGSPSRLRAITIRNSASCSSGHDDPIPVPRPHLAAAFRDATQPRGVVFRRTRAI